MDSGRVIHEIASDGRLVETDALPSAGTDDPDDDLFAQGFESATHLGTGDSGLLHLAIYVNRSDDTYLIETSVGDYVGAPLVRVRGVVSLLNALARWAPLLQSSAILEVVSDLKSADGPGSITANASAAAKLGVEELYPRRKHELDRRRPGR